MAVTGVAGWQNIRGLRLSVELPDEVYADRETLATVRLGNSKRFLSSFLLDLSFLGTTLPLVMVGRSDEESDVLPVTFPRRGEQPLPGAMVSSPFPVNFFVRRIGIPAQGTCVIFPRPLACPAGMQGGDMRSGGETTSCRKGYEGDLLRVSDYTGAEPPKLIHWRLSARADVLKVKELSGPVREPVFVDPLLLPGSEEERLSRAAFLVNLLIRERQVPTGLRLGERVIEPGTSRAHRLRLLTELARWESAGGMTA